MMLPERRAKERWWWMYFRPKPCRGVPAESAVHAAVSETNEGEAPRAQCKSNSYLFCCDFSVLRDFGVPCDCTTGSSAAGQCSETPYAFCCGVGTPCDCSQRPLNVSTENIEELTEVSVSAEVVEAKTTFEESSALVGRVRCFCLRVGDQPSRNECRT